MSGERIVAVFGSSRPLPDKPVYQQAERLGEQLAQRGFTVASGGYCGLMEAVSKGAAQAGGQVIGVTCEQIEAWREVRPNAWLGVQIREATLRERVHRLITMGDALIALPGGLGTLSEIALSWSLLQTGEINPRPLVLVGEMWEQTLSTFVTAANDFVDHEDAALLSLVPDVERAVAKISQVLATPAMEEEE